MRTFEVIIVHILMSVTYEIKNNPNLQTEVDIITFINTINAALNGACVSYTIISSDCLCGISIELEFSTKIANIDESELMSRLSYYGDVNIIVDMDNADAGLRRSTRKKK